LFTELKLDDKKPSQLQGEMSSMAPYDISEDVLHSLWMNRMPISVRWVLTAREGVELTKLTEISDRILDHNKQSQVMATNNPWSKTPTSPQLPTLVCSSEEKLADVKKQISELSTAVKSI
jgi:hypothetical protein